MGFRSVSPFVMRCRVAVFSACSRSTSSSSVVNLPLIRDRDNTSFEAINSRFCFESFFLLSDEKLNFHSARLPRSIHAHNGQISSRPRGHAVRGRFDALLARCGQMWSYMPPFSFVHRCPIGITTDGQFRPSNQPCVALCSD